MTKTQRDLLRACWSKGIKAEYEKVEQYAHNFKKYDNMRMSEIDEVVAKLRDLGMKTYIIFSEYDFEPFYKKQFNNNEECIQWIENTLDLSKNWHFRIINS